MKNIEEDYPVSQKLTKFTCEYICNQKHITASIYAEDVVVAQEICIILAEKYNWSAFALVN